jgi:hypothetical protein
MLSGSDLLDAPDAVAVICSAHINAAGVALALREIGWRGRVVCVAVNGASELAARWPGLCDLWRVQIAEPGEILDRFASLLPAGVPKAFFFNNESFLETFASERARRLFPEARWHVPSMDWLAIILDKPALYQFVADHNLAQVPRTLPSSAEPWREFGEAFRVRPRRSRLSVDLLPRGMNVRSPRDLDEWRRRAACAEMSPNDWVYQELLSTEPRHTVSVCGWHDSTFRFYVVTRKVRVKDDWGWLVELVDDQSICQPLQSQAASILDAVRLNGPFEMEFVLDPRCGSYKMIELNARFWMQHRLAGYIGANCIVRRYLGCNLTHCENKRDRRFWINTDEAIGRMRAGAEAEIAPFLSAAIWSFPLPAALDSELKRPRNEGS